MTPASRTLVIVSTLAVAGLCAWAFRPNREDALRVAVHEGKVRLETPRGEVEVPAGRVARAARGAAPLLLSEAAADEKEREGFLKEPGAGAGEPGFLKPAEEPAWKQALRERLRQQVHLMFEDVSFKDAKGFLEIQGKVVINVDKLAQEANPALDDTLIQLASPDEGMSLESALNYLTKAVGLAWTLRDEVILVSTEEGCRESPEGRAYDVRSLLGEAREFKTTERDLIGFIKGDVDKTVWDSPEHLIQFKNGRLFVVAPPGTHERVRQVLSGLWDHLRTPPSHLLSEPPEEPWKQTLRERLRQMVHFQFEDVSFKDAKGYLEVQGRVVINVDRLAQEANLALDDTLIQMASPDEGMSLESALNHLTQALGLAWTLRDETVMITTQEGLRKPSVLQTYDVRNLLVAHRKDIAKESGKLRDLLLNTVDEAVWDSPECSIQYFMGSLFVCAPPDTQKKVRSLLRELGARDAPKR
jgi:hypothetical protein